MAELKIQVKADITGIEKLIDQLKGLQTYKMYEGADQTLVDLDDVVKIFADHVEAEVAQPQWRCEWIPCSERLPERGKDVLVTRDYDGREDCIKSCRYVEVASCYGEDGDITWNSFSDEYKMRPRNHHVVAWMPLPEPYKGKLGLWS